MKRFYIVCAGFVSSAILYATYAILSSFIMKITIFLKSVGQSRAKCSLHGVQVKGADECLCRS